MGNELGPDAKAFGAELRWTPRAAVRVSLRGQSVVYSSSVYQAGYDINGRWIVSKTSSGTDELREMGIGTLAFEPSPSLGLNLRAGVERTRNELVTRATRHSYVVDAGVRWRWQ
jgi:hypothetical protein